MQIIPRSQLPTVHTGSLVPNRILPRTTYFRRPAGPKLQVACHELGLSDGAKPTRSHPKKAPIAVEDKDAATIYLHKQIQDKAEYYFSYDNLCKDEELRRTVLSNSEGYVPLVKLAGKRGMRMLSTSLRTIKASLRQSEHLVFNSNRGVRRRIPVRNLPRTAPRALVNGTASEHFKMLLVVAAALIDSRGRVLLAKRPEGKNLGGLWEFPGGKVNEGEIPEAALIRELKEELNIQVAYEDLKPITFASHAYDDFHLLMPLYECSKWKGEARGQEGQELAWVGANDLDKYDMPQADQPLIAPVQAVVQRLAQSVISDAA